MQCVLGEIKLAPAFPAPPPHPRIMAGSPLMSGTEAIDPPSELMDVPPRNQYVVTRSLSPAVSPCGCLAWGFLASHKERPAI